MTEPGHDLRALLAKEIGRHLPRLEAAPVDPEAVRAVLHALKGSAAMAREPDLALVLGHVGAAVRAGDLAPVGRLAALLRDALARLQRGDGALATRWPEPPPLLRPAQVEPDFLPDYLATIQDRLAELDHVPRGGDPTASLEQASRTVHAIKGASGSVGDDVTAWYCHGLESELRAPAGVAPETVLAQLAHHRTVIALLVQQPESALQTLGARHTPDSTAPTGPARDADTLLRIPAGTVDRLVEQLETLHLVSDELRVAANAARRSSSWLRRRRDSSLDPAAEAADRVALTCLRGADSLRTRAGAMRDEVAALRRTTVRSLFDRVRHAVQRLVATADRRVRVETHGAELNIDRRVAEQLLEPLLQLTRNAFAHGIEPAEERRQAGKPETGTIRLGAERLGDWLRLVVEDDGRGLDVDRIRQVAVRSGAVPAQAAQSMPQDELVALLFAPGLTTHEQPDLLAGRGVGLQLARDLVRRLGGVLRLSPRPQGGTVATIELPADTGTVEVLSLSCAGHGFALPTGFAGSALPLDQAPDTIALGACLGLPGPHQPRLSLELVVHGVESIRIGIDELGAIEEASVRALPPLIAAAGPYAGAILRSDGSLRLALDAAVLAARAWARTL